MFVQRLGESDHAILADHSGTLFRIYLGLQAANLLKNSAASQDLSKLVETNLLKRLSQLCNQNSPQTFIS